MDKLQLLIASSNRHKLEELNAMDVRYHFIGLKDIGWTSDIPETGDSFKANALIKAQTLRPHHEGMIMSEDSGLVVPALNGAPGIYSARYAGEHGDATANMQKLIANLDGATDRSAYYQSTICLLEASGDTHYFEGRCYGHIAETPRGSNGFGYDPLFIPEGYVQTFGELSADVKKKQSHRAKAVAQLFDYLNRQ